MDEIKLTCDKESEKALINAIAERARRELPTPRRPHLDWVMDFTAVHCNGNPLRLAALLDADDFNFTHDAAGIRNCLDRTTGKLANFFVPRYSARPASSTAMAEHMKTLPRGYLERKLELVMPLLEEARDALPAITERSRKLRGISSTLADRMDVAGTYSMTDWEGTTT